MRGNLSMPILKKFMISNNSWNGGMHDIIIRHTDTHSSVFTVTIDEMEQLFTVMHQFLTPYHAECEHWCGTQACNVDCGDSECAVCEMDLTEN